MRTLILAGLIAAGSTWAAPSSQAQPVSSPKMPNVPTTRVIAIGTVTTAPSGAMPGEMQQEVGDTVRLYLAGKIDQWFVRRDKPGVVFVLNVATVQAARATLDTLPLSKAGIMTFELIPVGPLAPLGLLTK